MNDTVLVKDPDGPTKKIKKGKILLQTPVRKLHSDLIRDIPKCASSQGKILVSDTKLRAILPLEMKQMSERYK